VAADEAADALAATLSEGGVVALLPQLLLKLLLGYFSTIYSASAVAAGVVALLLMLDALVVAFAAAVPVTFALTVAAGVVALLLLPSRCGCFCYGYCCGATSFLDVAVAAAVYSAVPLRLWMPLLLPGHYEFLGLPRLLLLL
jgi:hypothetical protein